jgi:hypothetical protein
MSQQQFIPTPKFEEYKERFKDFYKMRPRPPKQSTHDATAPVSKGIRESESCAE